MNDLELDEQGRGEFIIYTMEDGRTRIECRFEDDTLWLSQALMAELFQTTPQNITLHLKALYEDGELSESATCKDYLQVRQEGKRQVQTCRVRTDKRRCQIGQPLHPRNVVIT
jgi:hypothetical protein